MSQLLAQYANRATPPSNRVSCFISGESRLTWLSLLLADFPTADAYLVGGSVRDTLLGILPNDIDLVIRGLEIKQLTHWLQNHGAISLVGRQFGTIKFSPHGQIGKEPIDIALPRVEKIGNSHKSGRKDLAIKYDPQISIVEDLSRRDFTINAMAYDIRRQKLIDPFFGMHDLEAHIIRAVGTPEERFYEDGTRMLRAIRFASQISFSIEEHTWNAIRKLVNILQNTNLMEDGTHNYVIARELIGREFLLGFARHPMHTLRLWKLSGALKLFIPKIAKLDQTLEKNETLFEKTLLLLEILSKQNFLATYHTNKSNPTVLVAALFAFTNEKDITARNICKKLYFHQFPQTHTAFVDTKRVTWLLSHLDDFINEDPAGMRPSIFEKNFCNERGTQLLMLMHAISIALGKHSVARERIHTAHRIANRICKEIYQNEQKLPELISGHDLKLLNITPGPQMRELKSLVRDAQLSGNISSQEEALELVRINTNK